MKTILHCCCGPCASACVPRLKAMGRAVTVLFANSNIDTREEFDRRLAAAKHLAQADGVAFEALAYDHDEWLAEVAAGCEYEPEKGARCARCFRYNLRKAAEWARAHGFEEFTTSLTVSPHKVSSVIFAEGGAVAKAEGGVRFLAEDFKKNEGFKVSVRRTSELGLYRQDYCGCEFSKERWTIHARRETASTNADARAGRHRDVFTADFQTAGRGRLDHRWVSPPGTNLMMSAVLSVQGLEPAAVVTLPLVAGLSVAKALEGVLGEKAGIALKWPNDVLVRGRKIAGILCERNDGLVIVGIGVNVGRQTWPPDLRGRATSLFDELGRIVSVGVVRRAVLDQLGKWYGLWRARGFAFVHPQFAPFDILRGRMVSVLQTDADPRPVTGLCAGVLPDGTLDVGGTRVYAGEAHVERWRTEKESGGNAVG